MPPFETTQHPKPFKQRKSLGMCLYIIQALDDLLTNCQNQMLSLFFLMLITNQLRGNTRWLESELNFQLKSR